MDELVEQNSWAKTPGVWDGLWQGASAGAPISIIFNSSDRVGSGPRLHTHPYVETFVIRGGRARFTVGDKVVEVESGQILVAPAGIPHKFVNLGPDRLETINIHASGTMQTTWLE